MFSFFGGRKKSPEREDSAEDNLTSDSAASSSDYVFVEKRRDVSGYGNPELYPSLPYPVAPPTFKQPERATNTAGGGGSNAAPGQNCLSGVPFKLSSKAEYDIDSFMGADVSEIMYQIRNLNLANFEYDFEVERSVLREVGRENF